MGLQKTAIIIGAGPAGLTAALEFCRRSAIHPIVLEASDRIGGISCTIRHNGNRIDIGGHRFFSKSDRVMDWWTDIMPIAGTQAGDEFAIRYQNQERMVSNAGKKGPRTAHCAGSLFQIPIASCWCGHARAESTSCGRSSITRCRYPRHVKAAGRAAHPTHWPELHDVAPSPAQAGEDRWKIS